MPDIQIPNVLARTCELSSCLLRVEGESVGEAAADLCQRHPVLEPHIVERNGAIKDHFAISVDGAMADAQTPAGPESRIELMLAASGGLDDDLTPEEIRRYARHLTLPGIGRRGQRRLREAAVLVVGAGGLGSPAALYLAAAGVGRIGIIDPDRVEVSNLQRQVIHDTSELGNPKVASAGRRLREINPLVKPEPIFESLTSDNGPRLVHRFDIVIDGSDNFATRYLVNALCRASSTPLVFGAVQQFEGQASVFDPRTGGPCYQCVFRSPPPAALAPNCAAGGVLGPIPGMVGTVQANETLKIILGLDTVLSGYLWRLDALTMRTSTLEVTQATDCPTCRDPELAIRHGLAQGECAAEQTQTVSDCPVISARKLDSRLNQDSMQPGLLDVREPEELEVCRIDGAINLPLSRIERAPEALDMGREYVVVCRSGARSARAADYLRREGFERISSLKGGLLAWSREVEPQMVVV